jgi:hypothetical protein
VIKPRPERFCGRRKMARELAVTFPEKIPKKEKA